MSHTRPSEPPSRPLAHSAATTNGTVVVSANDVDETDDGYPSLEAFGDGGAPHTWETSVPPPEPEPKIEEPEGEGLWLRERLARAAAGRKRLS